MRKMVSKFKNPLNGHFGYQLRRASALMMGDLAKSLGRLGLRTAEASILILIGANPGITQGEAGQILGIQRANMVPLTAQLMAKGLIERERADGRSHSLHITSRGKALAEKCENAMLQHEEHFIGHWPVTKRRNVISQLQKIWE
jgi:DNA-binding MarR family transcriptional regulator